MNQSQLIGSIALIKGESWLSRRIVDHMDLYGKLTGRKYSLPYSHAETIVMFQGELCSVGARFHGAEILPYEKYYAGKKFRLLKPVVPLTYGESQLLTKKAVEWSANYHRPYQYFNFLAWIHHIKSVAIKQDSTAWIGKDSDKKMYCYEMAARFAELTGRWHDTGKPIEIVSIYDLAENPNYILTEPIKF